VIVIGVESGVARYHYQFSIICVCFIFCRSILHRSDQFSENFRSLFLPSTSPTDSLTHPAHCVSSFTLFVQSLHFPPLVKSLFAPARQVSPWTTHQVSPFAATPLVKSLHLPPLVSLSLSVHHRSSHQVSVPRPLQFPLGTLTSCPFWILPADSIT
jgi:hypothetical protein